MNTDYKLRQPNHNELRAVFGTLSAAKRKTGGDHVLACFLIANPDKISQAPDRCCLRDQYATALMMAADEEEAIATRAERRRRIDEREKAAVAAYKERGTIKAAMMAGNFGFKRAKALCTA